ncbi:MAG TPA: hypothetical protein VK548_21285, partial [Candidatus Acidoferrum sp.]|nr:hypothetical protein [Candidatus Acidoferrum sp.]
MSTVSATLDGWNLTSAEILDEATWLPHSPVSAWFRIADGTLELISDYPPLLEEIETIYGDCGICGPLAEGYDVRCTATAVPGLPLLALTFEGSRLPDLVDSASSPYRFRRRPDYVEATGPLPGWRALVTAECDGRLFLTADRQRALVNLDEAPREAVVDWIVSVVQSVQAGVLFIHAATVGIGGSGALIIAPSGGGKSTTALAVARRKHAFLGDDVAAVRLATREVVPFPKAAGLRDGSLARSLESEVQACRHVHATNGNGLERILVRVSDLFPWSMSGPLPLKFAFVLDALGERAEITELRPGLEERARLLCVATEASAAWAVSPGRDLMLFLSVIRLLSG